MKKSQGDFQQHFSSPAFGGMTFTYSEFGSFCFPKHFHDYFVIELVLQGADAFFCNGIDYTAAPGDVVLINPGEVHTGSPAGDTPLRYFSFYPDADQLKEVSGLFGIDTGREMMFGQNLLHSHELKNCMLKFSKAVKTKYQHLETETAYYEMMYELLKLCSAKPFSDAADSDQRIEKSIEYMREHYAAEIQLSDLANLACLNPQHFIRVFKKKTGVSPYAFLLNLRLEAARKMLRETSAGIAETAIATGFYDSAHFNHAFRKQFGVGPGEFRKSNRQYFTS